MGRLFLCLQCTYRPGDVGIVIPFERRNLGILILMQPLAGGALLCYPASRTRGTSWFREAKPLEESRRKRHTANGRPCFKGNGRRRNDALRNVSRKLHDSIPSVSRPRNRRPKDEGGLGQSRPEGPLSLRFPQKERSRVFLRCKRFGELCQAHIRLRGLELPSEEAREGDGLSRLARLRKAHGAHRYPPDATGAAMPMSVSSRSCWTRRSSARATQRLPPTVYQGACAP